MKQLLNTLFVTSEDIYLSLEGENILANRDKQVLARYPLHTLQTIVTFSYPGASPALMGACGRLRKSAWITASGYRIPYLSACWMPPSAAVCKQSC